MKCKLTFKEGGGIKAHIIPKSFYNIDCANKIPLKIISSNKGIYPQKSQMGIYDSNIVTKDGEAILQLLDDYACDVLIKNISSAKSIFDNEALQIDSYDYHKLKLFFLSVLWRASVSQNQFFKKVYLGIHEEIIRKALLIHDGGSPDFYSVVLSIFDKPVNNVPTLSPEKSRVDGVNCYKLYLSNFSVLVKVDSNGQFGEPLRSFCMENGRPLYILTRNFKDSKERGLMKTMAEKSLVSR
jgi:hypothetical protein